MKAKTSLTCCFVFLAHVCISFLHAQPDPNFHIYLMFGQSNMEGQGTIESQDRVTSQKVKMMQDLDCPNLGRSYGEWYPAAPPLSRCWFGLGPGDSFGKMMGKQTPDTISIGLINASISGCSIVIYQKNCPDSANASSADVPFHCGYCWLLDLAKKAQQVGVIKGILFHQGETNNTDPSWKYTVQQIVANLKTDLGLGDIPFLAGELLYSDYGSCCSAHNVEINKLPGLIPNAHVISAKGLPGADNAHFTSASYRTFGERYAREMLQLVYGICDSTAIEPWMQVNSGSLVESDSVLLQHGAKLLLSPQPSNLLGSWLWSGAGTSGELREALVNTSSEGSYLATATYTNECGTKSRLGYKVVVCDSTLIVPWYQVNGGEWVQAAIANVYKGSSLILGPQPDDTTGSWNWSGAGTSGSEREQTIITSTVKSTVAKIGYTNSCGATSHLTMGVRVCDSVKIESWIKVGSNFSVQIDSVEVNQGEMVKLSPYAGNATGNWSWTGAGLSGNLREQMVNTDTSGKLSAIVTYTNLCGFESRLLVTIVVKAAEASGTLDPASQTIQVYPNPSANGTFTLEGIEQITSIEIFDMLGEKVLTFKNHNQASRTISIERNPGLYILHMKGDHRSYYRRIVIE